MKRLAVFSIFSPMRLGIADYSDDLVESLAEHYDITCYVNDGCEPDRAAKHATIRSHREFRGDEGLTLYQIGNSTDLSFLLPYLVKHGGTVTLHDACQHDITYPYFKANRKRFAIEVFRSLDADARRLLIQPSIRPRRMVERLIRTYKEHPDKREHFSFSRFILRHSNRLIVHSNFLADYARDIRKRTPITVIPHGVHPVPARDRGAARATLRELGVPVQDDTILIISFGAIQRHKRLTGVLEGLAAFTKEHANVRYLVVGPRDTDYDFDAEIAEHGVGEYVTVLDSYLPMEQVNECIAASDLSFNLRWPSLGSTSGTLYKVFAIGRPVAVTAADSFRDYPEDFIFRIPPPGQGEREACLAALRAARDEPERLRRMGDAARKFAEDECSWARIASRYAEVLESGRPN